MGNHDRFPPQPVAEHVEDRAVLVGVDRPGGWALDESVAELARLADTAGATVVATVTQRLKHPDARTFIGKGKLADVADVVRDTSATVVVFDDDLSPSQQGNVEDSLPGVKVLDRTALILDIFALHATSNEGKLQVELAQMEYLLPRLRGLWRHFEQAAAAAGGKRGIGTRGPGETQLETDRRLVRKRIGELKRRLKQVAGEREVQRSARARSGVFRICLVGYTNAGKSSTLNALTGAGAAVEDQLFATLDATTRTMELAEGRQVTLTDTVGFINKLPHGLVEAFKSTLDETREADLLLHVIDASHPQRIEQSDAVRVVLQEIGAADKRQLAVYNKVDLLRDEDRAALSSRNPNALLVSAATREGLDALRERIADEAARGSATLTVLVPYDRGDLVGLAHKHAQVVSEEHTADGTRLVVRVPSDLVSRFEGFSVA